MENVNKILALDRVSDAVFRELALDAARALLDKPLALVEHKAAALYHEPVDRYAVNQARKFFVHYFKGADGGKALRATKLATVIGAASG